MRTTIEFPSAMMRAAKSRAAVRGESLKTLLTRAVSAELGGPPASASRQPVVLPLFGEATGPRYNPSNADLEAALAETDALGAATPPARKPSRRLAR